MIKNDEKTNYYFLLKYLTTITAVATATIAATTLKYSATALTIPPIIVSPFIQPLIIAAVTLALIAYTMTCLFCNNNNTSIYTTPNYDYNTIQFFGGYERYRPYYNPLYYDHGISIHNHANSMPNNGGSTHNHRVQ